MYSTALLTMILTSPLGLRRYHAENHNLVPGDFKFGPLFMRLCYELGLEDFAAATVKDTVCLSI